MEEQLTAFERLHNAEAVLPGSVTELVTQLGGPGRHGGGTRRAAEVLGVSQRSVQRYVAYERGERGTHTARPPGLRLGAQRAQTREGRRAFVDAIRARDGMDVMYFKGVIIISGDEREREIVRAKGRPVHMSAKDLALYLEAFERGDDLVAAEHFTAAFLEAYGAGAIVKSAEKTIPHVERIDIHLAGQ